MTTELIQEQVSDIIRRRIVSAGARFYANDNISEFIAEGEIDCLLDEVTAKMEPVLQAMVIDTEHDHNTQDTARRLAKMWITEVFRGRYMPMPKITYFPNEENLDSMAVTGPITVRSTCSHHFAPFIGEAWVGFVPGKNVVGLSKFNRLIDWVFSRPQIQEEGVVQIANILEAELQPKGLGVIVRAKHMCIDWRGAKDKSVFTTSVLRGCMKETLAAREEFLDLVRMNGG